MSHEDIPFTERGVSIDRLQTWVSSSNFSENKLVASLLPQAQKEFSAGRVDIALLVLVNLARVFPINLIVLGNLASALATTGDNRASLTVFRRAFVASPDNQMIATNLAAMLQATGENDMVGPALERIAVLSGADAEAWSRAGRHYGQRGCNERAEIAFRHSIALKPDDHARRALVQVLSNADRSADVIQVILEMESVDDNLFSIFCKLCMGLGAFATMERGIQRMLPQVPSLEALADLAMGHVWRYRDDPVKAKACFKSALKDSRTVDLADDELLGLFIRHGTFEEISKAFADRAPWRDVPITDPRSTLRIDAVRNIHTLDQEEGFNISVDVLFSQFIPETTELRKGTRLHVNSRAVSLFQRSFPNLEVHGYAAGTSKLDLGAEDLHIRELPFVSKQTKKGDDHRAFRRLCADPERLVAVRRRHAEGAGGRPVVGLCWRSSRLKNAGFNSSPLMLDVNQMDFDDYINTGRQFWRKCIPLSFFGKIIGDRDFYVVSQQYGLADWEIKHMGCHPIYQNLIVDSIDHFGDLDDVVAEIAALDAFITIPCGYAHIAGALGVPTYLMLNDAPVIYWDWQRRFPSYPEVSHFVKVPEWYQGDMKERKYFGDWAPQVDALHQKLRESFNRPIRIN